jgi:hypothetical protein
MRLLATAAVMLALVAGPAFAQTPTPAAAAPAASAPAAMATPAAGLTKDGKPRMKDVRATCQSQAKGQGLKGDGRRQAVEDCIIKQRPDMAASVKCRMDPQTKGMDKDARRAFVKDCVGKSKG